MNNDGSGGSLLRKNERDSQACKSASGLRKTDRQTGSPEPSALERHLLQVHVVNNRSRDQLLLNRKAGAGRGLCAGQANTRWAWAVSLGTLPRSFIYNPPFHICILLAVCCVWSRQGRASCLFLPVGFFHLLILMSLSTQSQCAFLPQVYPGSCAPKTPLRGAERSVRVI